MSDIRRVYSPTVNAWRDVHAADVKAWTDMGWTTTKGKHIDDSGALPVGEGRVTPLVPRPAPEPKK